MKRFLKCTCLMLSCICLCNVHVSANPTNDWDSLHETSTVVTELDNDYDIIVNTVKKQDGTYLLALDVPAYSEDKNKSLSFYNITSEGDILSTFEIARELENVGDFTIDEDENIYVAFGTCLEEYEKEKTALILAKYNPEGNKISQIEIKGNDINSFHGVKEPFHAGECDISVYDGIVACTFSRLMFQSDDGLNHQASHSFMANSDDLSRIDTDPIYCSHSFEEEVIYDGESFIFLDRGDAYARGFQLTKKEINNMDSYDKEIVTMNFKIGPGGLNHDTDRIDYNQTFSEMGSLIKLKDEYLFFGTYENVTHNPNLYSSRNLFTQKISLDFEEISEPKYITNYSTVDNGTQSLRDMHNALSPKAVFFEDDTFAIIFVESKEDENNNLLLKRNMVFFDNRGNATKEVDVHKSLPGPAYIGDYEGNVYDTNYYYDKDINKIIWFECTEKNAVNYLTLKYIEPCTGDNCPMVFEDFTDLVGLNTEELSAIRYAFENGIINGYENKTFGPHKYISRAEFSQIIARKFGYKDIINKELEFSDIPNSHWAYNAIAQLVNVGAINGVSENRFAPDELITCEQACKILTTCRGWASQINIEKHGGYPKAYTKLASHQGILDDVKNLDDAPITRLELVMIINHIEYAPDKIDIGYFDRFSNRENGTNWYWDR